MPISELIEKSTIKFPRAISLSGAEKLLRYIADKLPANVAYTINRHRTLYHKNEMEISLREGSTGISGNIACRKTPIAFDSFEFTLSISDSSKLDTMQFNIIPGYELSEHRQEVRKLWDETRKIVFKYFSK